MEAKEMQMMCRKPPFASPCAACKFLRRRCGEKCILSPYFPADNALNFSTAHHVFGASNIIKMLQGVPCERRGDAVSSMVYEARARVRDPIYGCAGTISLLQQQISQLRCELAAAQAELMLLHMQNSNLLSFTSIQLDGQSTERDAQYKLEEDCETNMAELFSDEMERFMLCDSRL